MYAGIAGGLLVLTGLWHATEWMMDGRRRDTWMLVPVGLIYLALGWLLVTSTGGLVIQGAALLAASAGAALIFLRRDQAQIRKWVTWVFIAIDVVVVLALAAVFVA